MVGIGVIGAGYWGPNLIRNFSEIPGCSLLGVCDIDDKCREAVAKQRKGVFTTDKRSDLLSNRDIAAVVIATPASSHFHLAMECLNAGKHVFVEKPLSLTTEHCKELIAAAEKKELCLMVGHTFLYNAVVIRIKELIKKGALGDVLYVYCQRLNLGKIRDDLDVVWNLAPHDISILCYWFDALPTKVRAKGYSYIQQGIADVAFITMDFPGDIGASIHVSWLDPNKTRQITIVGTRKMIVYNDVSLDQKLVIYDKGVSNPDELRCHKTVLPHKTYDDFRIELRDGDITIPHMKVREPLREECIQFIRSIETKQKPLSDGNNGLDVVRILNACSLSMSEDGTRKSVV